VNGFYDGKKGAMEGDGLRRFVVARARRIAVSGQRLGDRQLSDAVAVVVLVAV
jgi:hypothetical protein